MKNEWKKWGKSAFTGKFISISRDYNKISNTGISHAVIVNVVKTYHLVYNDIPQHFLLYQDMFS